MNRIELNLLSKKENIMVSRAMVTAFMLTIDSALSETTEIKTIVSEAVTNAIVHGYESEEDKIIRLLLEYSNEKVYIEVEDTGIGIEDIEQAKEALYTSKPDEERSGLGFTIIEMFSDSYEVISNRNQGTLLKCYKKLNNSIQNVA